jgi:hypothetical protein
MLHACVQRFDVTDNLLFFCKKKKNHLNWGLFVRICNTAVRLRDGTVCEVTAACVQVQQLCAGSTISLFISLVYCAERTVRWFVVREKHCWMAADCADKSKRTGRLSPAT